MLAALDGRHQLPRGAVLVTFDDGYRDFRELAWPLLKQYRVPAVMLVPTSFVSEPDQSFWWDSLWQIIDRTGIPAPSCRAHRLGRSGRGASGWRPAAPLIGGSNNALPPNGGPRSTHWQSAWR